MAYLPKRLFILFILLGVVFGVYCSVYSGNTNEEKKHIAVSFQKVSVTAEIADSNALRVLGLSGRKSLSDKEGMWFDFKSDGHHSFWMKEMHFPIDIIWLDKDLRVIHIKENATPESYPETFIPSVADRFVLEVPAGFTREYDVFIGDHVSVHKAP